MQPLEKIGCLEGEPLCPPLKSQWSSGVGLQVAIYRLNLWKMELIWNNFGQKLKEIFRLENLVKLGFHLDSAYKYSYNSHNFLDKGLILRIYSYVSINSFYTLYPGGVVYKIWCQILYLFVLFYIFRTELENLMQYMHAFQSNKQ